jgi:LysR family transcriptional regulator, glycine cleavage system transcriptional activator
MEEVLMPVATSQYLSAHPGFAAGRSRDGVTLLHDAAPWDGAPEFIEWRCWKEAEKADWLGPVDGVQFNLASLAIVAALSHQGVAMARGALVAEDLKSGRLVNAFGRSTPAPARYVVLTRSKGDKRIRVFERWLRREGAEFERSALLTRGL